MFSGCDKKAKNIIIYYNYYIIIITVDKWQKPV